MSLPQTTLASVMTPPGRGAVATIAVRHGVSIIDGLDNTRLFKAVNSKSLEQQPLNRTCFGIWGVESPEDVVVCRTSEDNVEIHCHGGDLAVRRILSDLEDAGCQIVDWPTFQTEVVSRYESEFAEAISQATTLRTAKILLQQRDVFRDEIERLVQLDDLGELRERIEAILSFSNFARHLTIPWDVVLAGRPNVGKSSLINCLAGFDRAIVFDQPGTTRDVVSVETAFDGWPVQLSDTAGIRQSAGELEAAGIAMAKEHLNNADCQLIIVDASEPLSTEETALLDSHPNAIHVANKKDLGIHASHPNTALHVSALENQGIKELIQAVVSSLVLSPPNDNVAMAVVSRHEEGLRTALERIDRQSLEECHRDLRAIVN